MKNVTPDTQIGTTNEDINTTSTIIDTTTDADPFAGMSDEDFLKGDWKNHDEADSKAEAEVPVTDKGVSTGDNVTGTETTEVSTEDETTTTEDGNENIDDKGIDSEDANLLQQSFDIVFKDPIKAAGVELKIENMEEAVRLIQQGADYTRKMQELSKERSTHRAKIGLLEDNGLLNDPEALPRMIEAFKGNPEAILDLVTKYEIDLTKADANNKYEPKIAERTEHELILNDTIDELKANGSFEQVNAAFTGFVSQDEGKSYVEDSQALLTQNPVLLTKISEDMSDGSYEKVQTELALRKVKGTYDYNLPAVVNYGMVHNELFHDTTNETTGKQTASNTGKQEKPKPTTKKPKGVGVTPRGNGTNKVVVTPELLTQAANELAGMSDEEYLKIYG